MPTPRCPHSPPPGRSSTPQVRPDLPTTQPRTRTKITPGSPAFGTVTAVSLAPTGVDRAVRARPGYHGFGAARTSAGRCTPVDRLLYLAVAGPPVYVTLPGHLWAKTAVTAAVLALLAAVYTVGTHRRTRPVPAQR